MYNITGYDQYINKKMEDVRPLPKNYRIVHKNSIINASFEADRVNFWVNPETMEIIRIYYG